MQAWQKRILQRMEELDMSGAELARRVGKAKATAGHWLRCDDDGNPVRTPQGIEEFNKIGKELGVTGQWIMFGEIDIVKLDRCIKAATFALSKTTNSIPQQTIILDLASQLYSQYYAKPPTLQMLQRRAIKLVGQQ